MEDRPLSPYFGGILLEWSAPEHDTLELGPKSQVIVTIALVFTIAWALYTNSPIMAITFILTGITELLGGARGSKLVHPNDHVNLGQSSNDVVPTAIHVAASETIQQQLIPALTRLHKALNGKAREFDKIVKIGRTHLLSRFCP